MAFILALVATLGYSLQGTLMTSVYRSMDRLSASTYRCLSLGITMLPLLLFVPSAQFTIINKILPYTIFASFLAAFGNWSNSNAFRHLPVAVATALSMSFATCFVVLTEWLFFSSTFSPNQIVLFVILLTLVIGLGVTRAPSKIVYNYRLGILNSLIFGFFLGGAYLLVGKATKIGHPFLVGYLWEFGIGIFATIVGLTRGLFLEVGLKKISLKEFRKILIYSSPTVVGTGCYTLSMSMGSIAVATAILSTMIVFNAILAIFLFQEKLSTLQWLLIMLICGTLFGIKIYS
jgi:drug/metabolite transporter (DMT)-like permease